MPARRFPRVLIVSADNITAQSGTGITLRNLFGDWPAERLSQVHLGGVGGDSCGPDQMRYPSPAVPADFLVRTVLRGRAMPLAAGAPKIAAVPMGPEASRAARRHASLRALADLSPVVTSASVNRFVSDFAPEVVYSVLGSVRVTRIAGRVAHHAGVPLVPHFMDDWLTTLYSSGELGGLARRGLLATVGAALRDSPLTLCISPEMCADYSARLGIPCQVFVNPVECEPAPPAPPAPGGLMDFLYVGGLHLGRWETLVRLATTLRADGVNARLRVFAPDADLETVAVPRTCRDVMQVCGSLAPHSVAGELQRADVLVHVESFDDRHARFARLSMSTKIPQYFAAGRPVLGIGPADIASIAIIERSGAGVVATDPRPAALGFAVRALISDPALRASLGLVAHKWARDHFAAAPTRERFRRALATAASRS